MNLKFSFLRPIFEFVITSFIIEILSHVKLSKTMVLSNDPEPVWDQPVDVPEKWIQFVDDNVVASMHFTDDNIGSGVPRPSDSARITTRISSKGDLSLRRKLLDKNGRNPNGTGRWGFSLLLSQGWHYSARTTFSWHRLIALCFLRSRRTRLERRWCTASMCP